VWCIPVHLLISTVLAVLLYHVVEKPARICFGPRNPHQFEPSIIQRSNSFSAVYVVNLVPPEISDSVAGDTQLPKVISHYTQKEHITTQQINEEELRPPPYNPELN